MVQKNKFYKCNLCGNIVSVIHASAPDIVCCGVPMEIMEEHTSSQEGNEKHVPVVEAIEGGIKVSVGSVAHPMEENHFIDLIQVIEGDHNVIGKRLKPGEKPEAIFHGVELKDVHRARILCNVHGLWKN